MREKEFAIIYFTGEIAGVMNRSRFLRGTLVGHGYRVYKKIPDHLDAPRSIWFYGLGDDDVVPLIDARMRDRLERFKGKLVFFKNDDNVAFTLDHLPDTLIEKAHLFIRNQWPGGLAGVHPRILAKTGYSNPLIKANAVGRGKELQKRSIPIIFYGARTGMDNIGPEKNCRIEALRMIKRAGLPLRGGLYQLDAIPMLPPQDLLVPKISQSAHNRLLADTKICLALWGFNHLTYRFFEGLALRCLVVATSLSSLSFLDCGLTPNRHYVEIKPDLSDLIEKLEYYLQHLSEAQAIADEGHRHYKKYFELSGVTLTDSLYHEMTKTWHGLLNDIPVSYVRSRVARMILPFVKSI